MKLELNENITITIGVDFWLDILHSKIFDFGHNGASRDEIFNFLDNMSFDVLNNLDPADLHTLAYCFYSYSFEIYDKDFFDIFHPFFLEQKFEDYVYNNKKTIPVREVLQCKNK